MPSASYIGLGVEERPLKKNTAITYVGLPNIKFCMLIQFVLVFRYCSSSDNLTIDHVLPVAQGGKWEWENLVR